MCVQVCMGCLRYVRVPAVRDMRQAQVAVSVNSWCAAWLRSVPDHLHAWLDPCLILMLPIFCKLHCRG